MALSAEYPFSDCQCMPTGIDAISLQFPQGGAPSDVNVGEHKPVRKYINISTINQIYLP